MVCCVTGHRPSVFPFDRNEDAIEYINYCNLLSREIECLIRDGCTHFITGMAYGTDLDFAKIVLDHCEKNNKIFLEAALPYPTHPIKNASPQQELKNHILSLCARQTIVSPHYHRGCMQLRNQYMVDHSDIVLAIWNGTQRVGTWNTIQYAQAKGKPIRYIMLSTPCSDSDNGF